MSKMQISTSNQIIIVCSRCTHKILFSWKKKLVVSNILSFVRRKMLVKLSFCFLHAELFLLKNLFVLYYKTAIQATKNYNSVPLHAILYRRKKCSTKFSNKFYWKFIDANTLLMSYNNYDITSINKQKSKEINEIRNYN